MFLATLLRCLIACSAIETGDSECCVRRQQACFECGRLHESWVAPNWRELSRARVAQLERLASGCQVVTWWDCRIPNVADRVEAANQPSFPVILPCCQVRGRRNAFKNCQATGETDPHPTLKLTPSYSVVFRGRREPATPASAHSDPKLHGATRARISRRAGAFVQGAPPSFSVSIDSSRPGS
jgi:hypothetical protein